MHTYKILLLSLLSLLIFSCGENDPEPEMEIEIEIPDTIDLSFTSSPIDLGTADATFTADIKYGDSERNTFDIFLPNSDTPTPLVIYIHGGGFLGGDKTLPYNDGQGERNQPENIRTFLNEGIAFATINYSLLEDVDTIGVIKSLNDSKRCLQFIKYYASSLNINPDKIVLSGNSAGAGTALWIAMNDDLAEPSSDDPILRMSTSIQGAAALATQASYDLQVWEDEVFDDYFIFISTLLAVSPDLGTLLRNFYGLEFANQFFTDIAVPYRERLDFLSMMDANDPEIYLNNTLRPIEYPASIDLLYHHANHAQVLAEKADEVGLANVSYYGNTNDPSGETFPEFLIRKCTE